MILSLLRAQGLLVLLERAIWTASSISSTSLTMMMQNGLLYMIIKVFKASTPDGPCILGERAPILANGFVSTKNSNVPVQMRDLTLVTILAQDS